MAGTMAKYVGHRVFSWESWLPVCKLFQELSNDKGKVNHLSERVLFFYLTCASRQTVQMNNSQNKISDAEK